MSNELTGLKIQRGWPYLSSFLTSPLKGTVDFSSEVSYSTEYGLAVEQGKLLVNGISARYGDKDGLDLSRLEITNAAFNQKANVVEVGEVRLTKGDLSLSREADGTISLLSLLKKPQTVSSSAPGQSPKRAVPHSGAAVVAVPQGNQPAKPLSFRLRKFVIDRFNASVTDKMLREKPRFTLTNTSLSLSDLTWPRFKPSAVRFSSLFNKATPLKASGDITPLPFRYKGSISVGRLPLRDFEAYFPSNVNVFILGGYAATDMNVDISLKEGKPTGSFKGNASLRGFHAVDTVAEEDLLKWESLQIDEIQGNLEPFSLTLRQVALNGVYSKIIVRKDGTLNLQNLVKKTEQETGGNVQAAGSRGQGTGEKSSSPPMPQSAAAPPQRNISIGAVTVQDGTLSFVDNHMPQHFATTFYNLGGRISGLNSEESKFADVDLRGNLENHSLLQITGQINPLRDDLFVSLKISFCDIELSPITPYTSTFLGYTVEKGKLFLDLSYLIDKKQLKSENKVFIDQFTFGKKVESDKATGLPVKLGLALLKDRNGEIHLDLPVTGRTDDPRFNFLGVIWQVVKNVLVKAASSPLALLSSMFGGGQDLSVIQFSHGQSSISPQEEQKLQALAKALLDRPAIKVKLKGYVDREKDGEGYRNELLTRKLKSEKSLALSKDGIDKDGAKSGDVQLLPGEYAKYLTAVYKREKFPKPRNILGVAKELPPEEMKKLIITNTVIGDTELTTLAQERVVAVMNFLVAKGKVPAERVFQENENVFKAPEKDTVSRSRVELDAIAQ
jgi:flagellar motor protein MotB